MKIDNSLSSSIHIDHTSGWFPFAFKADLIVKDSQVIWEKNKKSINFKIKNQGPIDSTPFYIRVYTRKKNKNNEFLIQFHVSKLESSKTVEKSFDIMKIANNYPHALNDIDELIINVDYNNKVKESNEKNNIKVIDLNPETRVDYHPGEDKKHTENSKRTQQWNIEIPSGSGESDENLDIKAYRNLFRAPYIQNVTPHSAVVAYRTLCTVKEADSTVKLYDMNNRLIHTYYTSSSDNLSILVKDVTDNYAYDSDTFWSTYTGNDDRLNKKGHGQYRPNLEYRVTFKELNPNQVYWYNIEAQGEDANGNIIKHILAEKVMFKTAPSNDYEDVIKFIAMGDFGQADDKPSYYYDVFDLMHSVVRDKGIDFWLALGDIDNCTDGHPNAIDPFFFSVYNAYLNEIPRRSSSLKYAKSTTVKAFRRPPYYGILGGMPVYPTFGNHDIRYAEIANYDTADKYPSWRKFYQSSFIFPSIREDSWSSHAYEFNEGGDGFFYTYRYGNAIFISLAAPSSSNKYSQQVYDKLDLQYEKLTTYLENIQFITKEDDMWLIVFTHDHKILNASYDYGNIWHHRYYDLNGLFSQFNVNLVLSGHEHFYQERRYVKDDDGEHVKREEDNPERFDLFHIISGTGGYGDDEGAVAKRPGFVSFEIKGDRLKYLKYDTHQCYTKESLEKNIPGNIPDQFRNQYIKMLTDQPIGGRDGLNPHIKEYGELRQEQGKLRYISEQSQTFTEEKGYLPPKILEYNIKVETGDVAYAGTDAEVSIMLQGTKEKSPFIQLDNSRNNFEKKDKDNFTIFYEDIGHITDITVKHNNTGDGAGWFLEKISIVQGNQYYNFTAQQWISHSTRSIEPSITIKEDSSRVQYYVTVTTSNAKKSGTDAGVYIQLFGSQGKHTPLQRIDDTTVDDFEKGSVGNYIVYADEDLGEIDKLKLEHDNTGDGAGWKISQISINNRYIFNIDEWLESNNKNIHPSKIYTR